MTEGALPCPACGRPTLAAESAGETCPNCGWMDEGATRADPDLPGEGGVTLREARLNVARFDRALPPAEVGGS